MKAIVKPDSKIIVVTAFSGREYVQYESRHVPEGCEEEAEMHPNLMVDYTDPDTHQNLEVIAQAEDDEVPPSSPAVAEEINDEIDMDDLLDLPTDELEIITEPATCLAFTQSGKRCKNKPKENGYCGKHGGK